MIKNLKLKVVGVVAAIMVMAFSGSALAASVSTSEFGTFTYNLNKSGTTVTASTSITKHTSSTKVITALEVQNNATGATIFNYTRTVTGGSSSTINATNLTGTALAAFSSHEARGNSSTVKYLAEVF